MITYVLEPGINSKKKIGPKIWCLKTFYWISRAIIERYQQLWFFNHLILQQKVITLNFKSEINYFDSLWLEIEWKKWFFLLKLLLFKYLFNILAKNHPVMIQVINFKSNLLTHLKLREFIFKENLGNFFRTLVLLILKLSKSHQNWIWLVFELLSTVMIKNMFRLFFFSKKHLHHEFWRQAISSSTIFFLSGSQLHTSFGYWQPRTKLSVYEPHRKYKTHPKNKFPSHLLHFQNQFYRYKIPSQWYDEHSRPGQKYTDGRDVKKISNFYTSVSSYPLRRFHIYVHRREIYLGTKKTSQHTKDLYRIIYSTL